MFEDAVDVFERYADQELSFTDAAILAHSTARDIDAILSFDDDFDGLFDRLDPATIG